MPRNLLVTALATPYKRGKLDVASFERLVESQTDGSVDRLLLFGTTGEKAFLTEKEREQCVEICQKVAHVVPFWMGIGGFCVADYVAQARFAEEVGASAILVSPPSFYKCTPLGFCQLLQQIARAVHVPLVLYNAPSRCNYVLPKSVLKKLADLHVVGVKDAGTDTQFAKQIGACTNLLCGNDNLLQSWLQIGTKGVVSVASNVAPRLVRNVLDGQNSKEFALLCKALECQLNPIAIKYLLYKKGVFDRFSMRLPLTPASAKTQKTVDEIWEAIADECK